MTLWLWMYVIQIPTTIMHKWKARAVWVYLFNFGGISISCFRGCCGCCWGSSSLSDSKSGSRKSAESSVSSISNGSNLIKSEFCVSFSSLIGIPSAWKQFDKFGSTQGSDEVLFDWPDGTWIVPLTMKSRIRIKSLALMLVEIEMSSNPDKGSDESSDKISTKR